MSDTGQHIHDYRYKTPLGDPACWCGMPKSIVEADRHLAASVGQAIEQARKFAATRAPHQADDHLQLECEQKAMDSLYPALDALRAAAHGAMALSGTRKAAIAQLLDALDDNAPDRRKWEEDANMIFNGIK